MKMGRSVELIFNELPEATAIALPDFQHQGGCWKMARIFICTAIFHFPYTLFPRRSHTPQVRS